MNTTAQNAASRSVRNPVWFGQPPEEAPSLRFEVIHARLIRICPNPPRLKKIEILKLIYAISLRVLCNFCYACVGDRLAQRILVHKFNLFPDRRRWQIEKWVAQFRRQNLFPNASESELQDRAKELVMSYMI